MKKLLWLAMALGLLVSGCATKMIWTKDNYSEEEFKRDNYQCVQESRTQWSGGGSGLIGLSIMATAQASAQTQAKNLYKMCMESKGWNLMDLWVSATTGMSQHGGNDFSPCVVEKVFPNSPAGKAGIKVGDLIIEKNGHPINNYGDLKSLGKLSIGETVTYKIKRGDKEFVVTLTAVPVKDCL